MTWVFASGCSPDDLDGAEDDDPDLLLGLYRGVPLTERDANYGVALSTRITIFQRPHELECDTLEALHAKGRRTLLHELARHFGVRDKRLGEMDADRSVIRRSSLAPLLVHAYPSAQVQHTHARRSAVRLVVQDAHPARVGI